jgi:drug/metabolite transporter (DMT)-like permease
MGESIESPRHLMNRPISHLGAICFALAGFTFWVLCDSAIKLAGTSALPNYEIVAFLGIFIAMFSSIYALLRGEVQKLWPKQPKPLTVRAFLDVGNNLCVVIALRHLSLTLFYILVFMSPMVVAILGRFYLHERLDWRKVAAILTGFLGVVIAVDPFRSVGSNDLIGYAACAVCVSCFSAGIVWSRKISQTERTESVVFFSGLVGACVGLTGMLAYAAPLDARLLAILLVMGLLCALGSICIFVALTHTTAAAVSQYHYTQLLSGAIIAYLLFNEKPTRAMLVGAILIGAAGLYIAVRAARSDAHLAQAERAQ